MSGVFDMLTGYYPLAHIRRISPVQTDSKGWSFHHVKIDGVDGSVQIGESQVDEEILHRPIQLMPAESGTSLLRVWVENGVGKLGRTPIVAWALCFDGQIRVVTPQGVDDGSTTEAAYVGMPDGSVQSVGMYAEPVFFASAEEYLAHETDRIGEDIQRNAEGEA